MPINSVPNMRGPLLALGLFSMVAVGCGSTDDGDVIAQADKLCKTAQEKQLTLLDGTSTNSTNPKVMKAYLESSLDLTLDLHKEIADLTPPSDQKKAWATWLDSLNEQEKAAEKLIGTVNPGMGTATDSPYITALNKSIALQVARNKLATDLGLETCGQNTSI